MISQIYYLLLILYIKLLQGNHNNCHKDSRCQEDGYVCSKKPLVSERAIVAYRKAIEGTTIYKNAEDYALVIFMNSYGAPFYLSNDPFAYIEQ